MYTIAVDCMGLDKGPKVCVDSIINFLKRHNDCKIVAFGRYEDLKILESYKNIEIVDCKDVMPMTAGAIEAMRARETSMYKAIVSTKERNFDGVISAGSTAAYLTLATVKLKTIEGIERAALVTILPTESGKYFTVLDVGANVETSSDQLIQFAKMGRIYSQKVLKVENPKVYLLSNGAEDEKGSPEVKEANKILKETNFPGFKGNIESKEVINSDVDVLVTGGYVGNIFLKCYEGVAKMMSNLIKKAFKKNLSTKVGYLFAKKGFDELSSKLKSDKIGGAMLLGVNGVVVKSHGGSTESAFTSAMEVLYSIVNENALELIKNGVNENA